MECGFVDEIEIMYGFKYLIVMCFCVFRIVVRIVIGGFLNDGD